MRRCPLLLGRQHIGWDVWRGADHLNASIGSVASERFQNQEEFLRKHRGLPLVVDWRNRIAPPVEDRYNLREKRSPTLPPL
jgi:hypothetical protein